MAAPTYTVRALPFSKEDRAFGALVAVGMRLRIGAKRPALEAFLKEPCARGEEPAFWADAQAEAERAASTVESWLAEDDRSQAGAMLVHRDRLESALVAMGTASLLGVDAAHAAERSLARRLEAIDARARSSPELPDRVRGSSHPELVRSAELDPSSWWLAEPAIAKVAKGRRLLDAVRGDRKSAPPPATDLLLRVSAERLARPASSMQFLYAEVVGQEEEDAALRSAGAAVVARLGDGAVEVLGVGLGSHEVTPGFLIQATEGRIAVEVTPALPSPATRVKDAWWLPLAGAKPGTYVLRVVYQDGTKEPVTDELRFDVG